MVTIMTTTKKKKKKKENDDFDLHSLLQHTKDGDSNHYNDWYNYCQEGDLMSLAHRFDLLKHLMF